MPESPIQMIRLYEQAPEKALFGPYRVLPGLSPAQIKEKETQYGSEYPRPLRNLLGQCAGLEFENQTLSWDADGEPLGLFPNAVYLMDDDSGNHWVMDVAQNPDRLGPIFFCCHDPAVIVYQAHDLADFLERILSGKDLAATDMEIWNQGANSGKREGEWIVYDLTDEKIGSGAPLCLYHEELMGLERIGTSLKFRIRHRERNWWQRFRDKWR